jgi:curved DNA-binding protein CbpA
MSGGLFSVFVVAMFSMLLVPSSLYVAWRVLAFLLCKAPPPPAAALRGVKGAGATGGPRAEAALAAAAALAAEKSRRLLTPGFAACLLLAVVSGAIVAWYASNVASDVSPFRFDPYRVLNVAEDASDGDVKTAYRRLSLKYHPDRPGGDADKFREIARAHTALTDPTARRNMREYGNPEGTFFNGVDVGSFLKVETGAGKGGGHKALLAGYVVFLVILLPTCFWFCQRSTRRNLPPNEKRPSAFASEEDMAEAWGPRRKRRPAAGAAAKGAGTDSGDDDDDDEGDDDDEEEEDDDGASGDKKEAGDADGEGGGAPGAAAAGGAGAAAADENPRLRQRRRRRQMERAGRAAAKRGGVPEMDADDEDDEDEEGEEEEEVQGPTRDPASLSPQERRDFLDTLLGSGATWETLPSDKHKLFFLALVPLPEGLAPESVTPVEGREIWKAMRVGGAATAAKAIAKAVAKAREKSRKGGK